jgi:hypothetical protein
MTTKKVFIVALIVGCIGMAIVANKLSIDERLNVQIMFGFYAICGMYLLKLETSKN